MGRRRCGPGPALVLPKGHLSALACENAQASGHPVCEPEDGAHGSPAGLDAPAPPERLLGVGAAAPGAWGPGLKSIPAALTSEECPSALFGFPRFLPFFKSLPSRRLRVFDLEPDGWPQTPDSRSVACLAG